MLILRVALALVAAVLLVVHPRVDLLLSRHAEFTRGRRGILVRGRTRLRCGRYTCRRRRAVALDSIRGGGGAAVDDDVHVRVRAARYIHVVVERWLVRSLPRHRLRMFGLNHLLN